MEKFDKCNDMLLHSALFDGWIVVLRGCLEAQLHADLMLMLDWKLLLGIEAVCPEVIHILHNLSI